MRSRDSRWHIPRPRRSAAWNCNRSANNWRSNVEITAYYLTSAAKSNQWRANAMHYSSLKAAAEMCHGRVHRCRNEDKFQSHQHVQNSTVFYPLMDEDRISATPWFGEEIIMPQATTPHFIPTKILVPIDFSSSSDAALETASDLAQHFHAELYLVNVIPMLPMGTKTVSFPETEYLRSAEGNAERRLPL